MNLENGLWEFFAQIPLITRCYVGTILTLTMLDNFHLINPLTLFFSWDLIFHKLQVGNSFCSRLFILQSYGG